MTYREVVSVVTKNNSNARYMHPFYTKGEQTLYSTNISDNYGKYACVHVCANRWHIFRRRVNVIAHTCTLIKRIGGSCMKQFNQAAELVKHKILKINALFIINLLDV